MHRTVHCIGETAAAADDVWAVVADFDVGWHPMVAASTIEPISNAQIIRRFTATGDDTAMRERLTYLSHSDRTLAYTMVEGISGARRYDARLKITQSADGTTITWHADVDAASTRAAQIADGTKAIFDAGIATLMDPPQTNAKQPALLAHCKTSKLSLGQTPKLGLTVAPEGCHTAKTLFLYLHGIGGSRLNWDAQLRALGSLMPMAALDLRGYGDSTLGFAPTHIDEYCDDIFRVMAHFGADKVVLCGLSYGSWIAASFALRYPEKTAGLVLCGGCTGMSEAGPDEREAFRISRSVPLDAGQAPADFAPTVIDVIAGPNATKQMRADLLASMSSIPAATYRDALNCFCNPLETFDFAKATFPVMLLTGEHDKLAPPDEIRAVSQRFADAGTPFVRFEVIADAGHVCNVEQPDIVNRHLADFIIILAPKPSPKVAKRAEKRERILNAALREFSKNGYLGASMQAIADRAEVSKPTLYQYIGQKEDMFRAVLDHGRATILAPFQNVEGKDMVSVLWAFSWTYADYVLDPANLSIARLIIGEAERAPEAARDFHDAGPAQALAGIAEYLETQRTAGKLAFDAADMAGENLWSLILSGPRNHALHFPHNPSTQDILEKSIINGLRIFLRAYATQPDTDIATLEKISAARPL